MYSFLVVIRVLYVHGWWSVIFGLVSRCLCNVSVSLVSFCIVVGWGRDRNAWAQGAVAGYASSPMGDGRRQRGEKPQNYPRRGLRFFNRRRISPAGYTFIIPVSGVPRLAAEAYRLTNSSPTLFTQSRHDHPTRTNTNSF